MVTHVVLFKMKSERAEDAASLAGRLKSMSSDLPMLRGLEVGVNEVASARAYDVALIARFDSMQDLQAYSMHPKHREVLAYVTEVTSSVVAADYLDGGQSNSATTGA